MPESSIYVVQSEQGQESGVADPVGQPMVLEAAELKSTVLVAWSAMLDTDESLLEIVYSVPETTVRLIIVLELRVAVLKGSDNDSVLEAA